MLLSVDEYSGYLDIVPIKNKGQKHLVKAFETLEATYKRQQHTINTIQTDHEANLWSCNDALGLRGIKLTQVPPYQHAQRVERHVQEINTKQRCVLAGIQYELPKYLHGELLKAVVYNQNDIPQASHPTTTPRALFEGKRLDLKQRIMVPFGTLLCIKYPGKVEAGDKMAPRADVGIALGPRDSSYGSVRWFNWVTKRVCTAERVEIVHTFPRTFPFKIQEYKSTTDPLFKEPGRTITSGNFATPEQPKETEST
jgi:hypothetical protein